MPKICEQLNLRLILVKLLGCCKTFFCPGTSFDQPTTCYPTRLATGFSVVLVAIPEVMPPIFRLYVTVLAYLKWCAHCWGVSCGQLEP